MMKTADLRDLAAWIMLTDAPAPDLSPESAKKADFLNRHGQNLKKQIEDAASREEAVLIIDLVSEEPGSGFSAELTERAGERMKAAAAALAVAIGAEKIIVAAPEAISWAPEGAEIVRLECSPVLREDSALFHILETGELRSCPLDRAFPSQGYKGLPTVTVGAEDLLRLCAMAEPGYTETKIVIIRTGDGASVAEVPTGTTVGELLKAAGADAPKGVLAGGVTGTFTRNPESCAIGTGSMFDSVRAFGEKDCMADQTARLMKQALDLSCRKCVLCREGSWHMAEIFRGITEGKGKKEDLDMVMDIGPLITAGAFCSFGQNMAACAVSSVECNREELLTHIVKKKCPAGVCSAFSKKTYVIDPAKCTACGDCIDECDEMAIEGKRKFIHMIDQDMCTGCGKCVSACDEEAIVVNDGSVKVPKKLTKVGKF